MPFGRVTGVPTTFKRIGNAKSVGKRKRYITIEGAEGHNVFPDTSEQAFLIDGQVYPQEILEGDGLMLLSLPAQECLGLVKDVEAGTCYSKSENYLIKLYTVTESNLRATQSGTTD